MPAALDPRLLDALPPQLRAALEAQVDAQAEASAAEHEARARAEREAADPRAANAGMAGRVARLERLIARLRRARLGAGSERLGLDQLEPVLEGREAAVSEQQAGADAANGVRDTGRATPPAPGATASPGPGASRGAAARGASDRAARPALPVRRRRHGADRRGPRRAARRRAGAPRPGDGAAPPRLSARPRRGGAAPRSAGAAGADRGRAGERGDDRPGRRVEARRSHPPAAPGAASRPVRAWGWIAPRCRTGRGARGVPPPPDRRPIVARMAAIIKAGPRLFHGRDHRAGRPIRAGPGRAGGGRRPARSGRCCATTARGAGPIRQGWSSTHAPGRGGAHADRMPAGFEGVLQRLPGPDPGSTPTAGPARGRPARGRPARGRPARGRPARGRREGGARWSAPPRRRARPWPGTRSPASPSSAPWRRTSGGKHPGAVGQGAGGQGAGGQGAGGQGAVGQGAGGQGAGGRAAGPVRAAAHRPARGPRRPRRAAVAQVRDGSRAPTSSRAGRA